MKRSELIGEVAAAYLRNQAPNDHTEGTARFILDSLNADQMAAIARAILNDSQLAKLVEIKLPAHFMIGQSLPELTLTEERTTYFRNAKCNKPVLLVANIGDDEEQSLKELVPIGTSQLQNSIELWIHTAKAGLPLSEDHLLWWESAVRGLQGLRFFSLDQFADYVLRTHLAIRDDGQPIISALGIALPALGLPKDSNYFNRLNEKALNQASKWRNLYETAHRKQACFLRKQTPSGLLLSEDELKKAFDEVKDSIPEKHHATITAFIVAPSGWNNEAARLAECEWEEIKPLFDGLKREKFNLGKATLEFYDEREPELLNDGDRDYLHRLIARKTTQAEEEDKLFYDAHRDELREDRKLRSHWDRFIFGTPKETEDFLAGIVMCLEPLFLNHNVASVWRKLLIRCDQAKTKKGLRELNADAGLYFARRYKGLPELFGNRVSWEVGELFNFDQLVEEWKVAKKSTKKILNDSVARVALQLKFVLILEMELLTGERENYSAQFIWKFNPNTVASEFNDDLARLAEHPLIFCSTARETISNKGRFQTVDLANVKTFLPAHGRDSGSFVAVYKKSNDIALVWQQNLQTAKEDGLISEETAHILQTAFKEFETKYASGINGFIEKGLVHVDLLEQLRIYAHLLHQLCLHARGDRNRILLLKPLLQIGMVVVEGGNTTAIVAPWHPFRLAAMRRKAHLVANLTRHLLTIAEIQFSDSHFFFKNLLEELAHPFYPELVLGWQGQKPELLDLTDVVADYSLHESPLALNNGLDDTNENPADSSERIIEVIKRYLDLHPHERTNLSVVLYNSDSARLPQAVVDKLGALHEEDDDVRCQVILRHRNSKRLHKLYEKMNASDIDADTFNASEMTQDFMARLRISIMVDQAPPPDPRDGCPVDIVFSQDVIARNARVEWYLENADPLDIATFVPPRWSRRRPAAKDDMKSVVYLCCPVQSQEGWAFLSAITSFLKGDWDGNEQRRLLPARQLDFQDPTTESIFKETHNLGNWVVNYDELLDRRQLLNQKVKVIRYKQSTTHGRNIIISSNAPLGLLRSMVLSRLRSLDLDLDNVTYERLADRFIQDANDISGDIVLRAAKRGRNASELMGIVLSRFLVRHELGLNNYFGWYFLDDYAGWLGQREGQVADILILTPEQTPDGKLRLAIVITEAKYIDYAGLAAKRKESQKQLRDTVKHFYEAVFGSPERLDRELWLARLSDLLLDGIQFPASANINLADWRRAIREGSCDIFIRGYSHVFVSGPRDAPDCSSFGSVAGLENSYQEIFGRAQVRELVLRYLNDQSPLAVRQAIKDEVDENLWAPQTYSEPSSFVTPDEAESKVSEKPFDDVTQSMDVVILNIQQTNEFDSTVYGSWAYPGITDLIGLDNQVDAEVSAEDETWLKQIESRTKGALQQFQLQSKLVSSALTPNAALLKFAGSANLTIDQVLKRRSEFLTTYGLNIISVQPEPGLITLSIERPQRQIIQQQRLWRHWQPDCVRGNQELLIAVREDNGELLFLSPGKHHAPHTLIAGSTGSGKSVLMQNIIMGIAATNRPDQARIILIDPKQGVDYFQFDGLPHLEGGVIDQQEQAIQYLQALVTDMDNRYKQLKNARVSNLTMYNEKVAESERIPVIWLIHDEFADWMLVEDYKREVVATVSRLGTKARAAGIYLVFAAQRPDANVMPIQLRDNLGNRLILRVNSEGTSEIALGEKGAERLLGRGHLIAKLEGVNSLCYAQVPFVEPEFMERVVATICKESELTGHRRSG